MKSIREMKADHAFREIVTTKDELYARELPELTPKQKDEVLAALEDQKRVLAFRDHNERAWMERHFADKENRDFENM